MKKILRTIYREIVIVGVICASIFTIVHAISTPSFSVFDNTTSSVVANWGAVSGANYYNVSTTASGAIIKTTDTNTVITGLNPSTGYIFQIEAIDGDGVSSGFSTPTTTYTNPTTPTVSGFSNITTSSIQLNWQTVTEAVYYTVSSTAGTVTTTATTSVFYGLTPSTTYSFQVSAHDSNGKDSVFSSISTTSTQTLPQLVPPTISSFVNTTSSIQVFWDSITGASYYIISRATAQTVTSNLSTVGTNTSADYFLPLNRFYNYSASEMLYSRDEIGSNAGPIHSLWFYKDSGNTTTTVNDVTIYFKHTSSTSLTSGIGSTAGYTQVYSGSFPNNVSSGWVGVSTTLFAYNGTDNLAILIVKGNELFTSTRPYYRYTTTSAYRARYYYSDASAFSSDVTSLIQTLNRPNTKFGLTVTTVTGTIQTVTTTDTNFIFTNLSPSTTYYFQIRAVDSIAQSSVSSSVTSTFTQTPPPPAVPDFTNVSKTTSTAVITWGTVYGATYYTVSSTAGTVTTTNTNYTFSGLTPSTTYTFQVRAHDAYNQTSSFSAATSTVTDLTPPPTTPVFSSVSKTTSTASVVWGSVTYATYYTVSSTAGTVTTTNTNYTFSGLTPSTTYTFQVRAHDAYNQTSSFSAATSTVTDSLSPPATPTITSLQNTFSSIQVYWNAVSGASFYTVSSTAGGVVTTTLTTYTFSSLSASTTYYFQIKSTNIYGQESSYSSITSTRTGRAPTFPTSTDTSTSTVFNYTGAQQTFTVPAGVTEVTVDVRGASGGNGGKFTGSAGTGGTGGRGGRIQTTISVTPLETLYVYVGGAGTAGTSTFGGLGGFNGGGTGPSSTGSGGGGGGGGASDIRQGGTALGNRKVVAGGGGAGGGSGSASSVGGNGGAGGGTTGVAGSPNSTAVAGGGGGGTPSAGGAAGTGGAGMTAGSSGTGGRGAGIATYGGGGGGGGGYYGGGGGGGAGSGTVSSAGGGGGSSYSSGTSTIHTQDYQTGDGQIYISASSSAALSPLIATTSTDASGYVTLASRVYDEDGDAVMITYRYSSGACGAYSNALATTTLIGTPSSTYGQGSIVLNNSTSTGYQLSNITTASGINTVTTTWDSRSQLPLVENGIYCLYAVISDGAATSTVATTTVTINNLGRPTQSSMTASALTNGSGNVNIRTTVSDVNSDLLMLTYRYSSGSCVAYTGSQATTTLIGTPSSTYGQSSIVFSNTTSTGYQLSNVTTTPGANTVTTTWDSKTQLPAASGTYCIYVVAYDGTSTSTAATTTVTLDNVAPAQPSISSFSDTATTITVNWSAVSGASYYTVSSTAGASVTTTLTTRTFSNLTPTTSYSFQILATDSYNNTSTYSSVSSTRTDSIYTPTISSFSGITTSSITVNWSAVSGTSYYTVSSTAGTATTTLTTYAFSGLSVNTLYNFQVFSTDINGRSSTSSAATSTRTSLPSQLSTTTIIDLTPTTSTVQVGWDTVVGASYYLISRSTSLTLGTETTTVFSYTGVSTTYTVPQGVTSITIDAYGAGGGSGGVTGAGNAGSGARMKGTVSVTPGEVLKILVGGSGGFGGSSNGGGGGSFVVRSPYNTTSSVLVAAGGGGGSGNASVAQQNGQITTSGGTGGAAGGTNGSGGVTSTGGGGSGGGFLTNGGTYTTYSGGNSFITGGFGGGTPGSCLGAGGFGGGGEGSGCVTFGGGGGGYSGGGGGSSGSSGGGGGSIINGTTTIATAGGGSAPDNDGQIVIFATNILGGTITTATTTNTNYLISGLSPSTTYYFTVNAVDQYGQVGVSSTVSSTTTLTPPPPATPAFVSSTNNTSSIQISWGAVLGVSYYTVSSTASASVTTSATTLSFTGLTPSTTYNFQVKANDAYNQSSTFSGVLATSTVITSVANAPTLSSFTNVTSNTIQVNWNSILWTSFYTVSSTAGTVTTTNTSYNFTGLTPSSTHIFQVKSTDVWGRSTVYSTAGTTSTPKPTAPTSSSITLLNESTLDTSSTIQVGWDAVSGASYYILYYSTSATTTRSGTAGYGYVGDGTSTSTYSAGNNLPLDRYWMMSSAEMIYLPSELGNRAFTISSIGFYKDNGSTVSVGSTTIYMKNTSTTTLSTATTSLTGYTQVYSGSFTNSAASGWQSVNLSQTFSYNGTSSLQILIIKGFEQWVSGGPVYRWTSTTPFRARSFANDNYPWSVTTTLNASSRLPNISFNGGTTTTLANQASTTLLTGTINSVTTTQTSTIITGLSPSTTYYFQMKVVDAYNQFSASSTATSTITPPSPSPSSTTITSFSRTTSTITVNWSAASGAGYYTVSSTAGATVTTTQTTRTFTGLAQNTSYSFQVQPVNSYGVTTTFSPVTSTLTLATPPSITSFAWPTTSSIQITWSAVTGTTYYTVSSTAGTVTTTQTSYTFTGLTAGTTYTFQSMSNISGFSNASSTYILVGTYLSTIRDIGYAATFGTVNWNDTIPTGASVTMEVRAGNQSNLSDGVWTMVSKGGQLDTNFDGRRYYQYRATLFTSSTNNVPSVEDVSIAYYGPSTGSFISSPYDTGSALNFFVGLTWTATVPSSTVLKFQVRTSPDNSTWTAWVGPDGTNNTYFTDSSGGEDLPAALADGSGDRWIQYRAYFIGDGVITPTLSDVVLAYTVNAPPDILITTSTISQASDGTVTVPYSVRDLDTPTGVRPGKVSVELQYCTASCWIPGSETWATAASSSLSGDFGSNINVDTNSSTAYTDYTLVWSPKISYNNQYNNTTFKIRLRADDGESANNTNVDESNVFTLDTTDPVVTSFVTDARSDATNPLTITVSDDTVSGLEMKLSSVPGMSNDGANVNSGQWIPYTSTSSWNFVGNPAKVYYQIRDAYGNISSGGEATLVQTLSAPQHFVYQDTSNSETLEWREFLAWGVVSPPTNGFAHYTIYRSTDDLSYTALTTETNRATNFYLDQNVDAEHTYYYKMTIQDNSGNISNYSDIVFDIPNGQGGSDSAVPTITNVATSSISTQSVTITWDTDELSNSYVDYTEVPGGDFSGAQSVGTLSLADTATGIGEHRVILTGLTPNTTYYFQVRSIDTSDNTSISTSSPDGYVVTTLPGPSISDIGVTNISNTEVTVQWTTDQTSDSYVYYSSDSTLASSTVVSDANEVTTHTLTLTNLHAGTTYYYYVKSGVAEDKNVVNGEILYHTFTTLNDVAAPVMTFNQENDIEISDSTMIVTWVTNEPATTALEYGTSTSYGTSITHDDLDTNHRYVISGLNLSTLYYVRFSSSDVNNNTSDYLTFSTSTSDSTDYTPPVITSVTTTVTTDDQAMITWETNESATGQVYYGTSSSTLDSHSDLNANFDRSHSTILSSLATSTVYYYYVVSADMSGNTATSTPIQTFTTLEKLSQESEVLLREQAAAAAAAANAAQSSNGGGGGGGDSSSQDTSPPTIFNAAVAEITGLGAKIVWDTSEKGDSVVEFGETTNYGKAGVNLDFTTDHEIVLSDLLPITDYYYRISSADRSGNRSAFTLGSFTTTLSNETPTSTTDTNTIDKQKDKTTQDAAEQLFLDSMQKTASLIKSLSNQVSIDVLESSLLNQTSFIQELSALLPRPVIGGEPAIDESANSAKISWTTDKSANSLVEFSTEELFKENGVYSQTVGDSTTSTVVHSVDIQGLKPSTVYHYRLVSRTPTGAETISRDFTFTTKAESIEIGSYKIKVVSPEQATFSWVTSLPTDSNVSYTPYRNGVPSIEARQIVKDPSIITEHSVDVSGLEGGVVYDIEISGKDSAGNIASKLIQGFSTDDTDAPPVISQITTESSIIPGPKDRIQVIISWNTNELSTSEVFYRAGFATAEDSEFKESTQPDLNYTKRHVVVIANFEPASVYQFVVESKDSSGNTARSKTLTILTPQKEQSVFQVILGNFQDLFSWVGKLKQ